MKKPKLALIPATMGTKVFSVLPSNGSGDFDFTRASEATMINKDGFIQTVPSGQSRLEYPMIDGVVSGCPSLLLEPSRTNLVTYSEAFDNAYWTKTGSSVVSDAAISPDGSLNAFKLVEDSSNGNHRIDTQGISITNGVSYSFSMFFKYDNSVEWIRVREFGINAFAYFNIKDNTTGATNLLNNSEKIEDFGNGWKRVSFTYTSTTSGANFRIYLGDGDNVDGYQGDGTSGIYIYGTQLEQASYATSYIPTNGTAVTRAAETANGAGDASTFNDSEGVLMAEISALADDGTNRIISLSDGTNNNIISVQFSNAQSNDIIAYYNATGQTGRAISTTSYNIKSFNKTALVWNNSSFKFYVNGYLMGSDTIEIPLVDGALNQLKFQYGNSTLPFYGKTKQLQYFQTALTDSELEELTSWDSFGVMAIAQLYNIE